MNTVSNELLTTVSQLRDTVLKSISYKVGARDVRLSFQHWNGSEFSLRLRGVLQLSVSNTDDQSRDPVVVNAKVEALDDGGKEVLKSLGYLWYETDGKVKAYPGLPLMHFSAEGDTCIGVVCRSVELGEKRERRD